jgi:hypothetical protein
MRTEGERALKAKAEGLAKERDKMIQRKGSICKENTTRVEKHTFHRSDEMFSCLKSHGSTGAVTYIAFCFAGSADDDNKRIRS